MALRATSPASGGRLPIGQRPDLTESFPCKRSAAGEVADRPMGRAAHPTGHDDIRPPIPDTQLMSDTFTPDQLEAGRKLFAGAATFVKGVVALDTLPNPDRPEIA